MFGKQGGNDSFGVHCPTKTAPSECDIKRGRSLDVLASDMATRPSQQPGKPRVKSHMSVEFPDIYIYILSGLQWHYKASGTEREAKAVGYITLRRFSVSPCDGLVAGRRELRHGARLVPLCGITMYLDEQASRSKTLHRSQANSLSLSLSSGTATSVLA